MDVYKKAAELGFAGIYVSEKYGGCNLGRVEASLIFEGLATGKNKDLKSIINRLCWIICLY
jgi:alkylation response protein AidB-like acyl-CoA dehydrogenase